MGNIHRWVSGSQNDQIAIDSVGDKRLGSVDHDLILFFHGSCDHRCQITSCVGFCHGNRQDDISGDTTGQNHTLLGFSPEAFDIGNNNIAVQLDHHPGMIGSYHLLDYNDRIEKVTAKPSVFPGYGCAKKPFAAHFFPDRFGNNVIGFPLVNMRNDF